MKNFIFFSLIVLTAACTSGNSTDKKSELAKLKKEAAGIQAKIAQLEKELGETDSIAASEIAVTVVEPKSFRHFIEVQATIDADQNVSINPEIQGVVTRILVEPGDKVTKGALLAELDAEAIQRQLEEIELQEDFLKTVFEKQKSLWNQKVGSEMQFIKAKTDYEAVAKRAAAYREQLSMSRLTSPINGTVDAVNIKIGQTINPMISAFRVVNLSGLKVKAEVAEAYVSRVNTNDEVVVEIPDIKKTIHTKLTYSGQVIDPLNRTFKVEAALDPAEKNLHPNMVAILKIVDYVNDSAFIVPVNVVQRDNEGMYLYVAENNGKKNVAKKKAVRTGQSYNGYVEVVAGLIPGDKVVTTGYQDLLEGEPLKF